MLYAIKQVFWFIVAAFRFEPEPSVKQKKSVRPRRNKRKEREDSSQDHEFTDFMMIKYQVDRTFKNMDMVRDWDVYKGYKKTGIFIHPKYYDGGMNQSAYSFDPKRLPMMLNFTCVFKVENGNIDNGIYDMLITGTKFNRISGVEFFGGPKYEFTIMHIKNGEQISAYNAYIGIKKDGTIRPLRHAKIAQHRINSNGRRSSNGASNIQYFSTKAWGYELPNSYAVSDPVDFYQSLAVMVYDNSRAKEFSTQVVFKKNGVRVIACVPENTWKDFFKERIDVIGIDGKKSKIWHAVAAHTRTNGQNVRTHYRGSRHFIWEGYEVKIILPGLHSIPADTLDMSASDLDCVSISELKNFTDDLSVVAAASSDDVALGKHSVYGQ